MSAARTDRRLYIAEDGFHYIIVIKYACLVEPCIMAPFICKLHTK